LGRSAAGDDAALLAEQRDGPVRRAWPHLRRVVRLPPEPRMALGRWGHGWGELGATARTPPFVVLVSGVGLRCRRGRCWSATPGCVGPAVGAAVPGAARPASGRPQGSPAAV